MGWRRPYLIFTTLSLTLLLSVPLLEQVLLVHPHLLGSATQLLPQQGQFLFGEQYESPLHDFGDRRYGFRYRSDLEQVYRIQRDDLLSLGEVPGVDRLPRERRVTFRTGEHGFRLPGPDGDVAVVTVGDSFTMASNIDEMRIWPRILERVLDAGVLNLGVNGYGPSQEVQVLEEFGLRAKPRVAILAFFEGNDFRDEEIFARFRAADRPWNAFMRERERRYRYSLLRAYLEGKRNVSPVASVILAAGEGESRRELPEEEEIALERIREHPDHLNPIVMELGGQRLVFGIYPPYLDLLAWDRTQWESHPGHAPTLAALERFRSVCQENGVHPLVVLLPSKADVVLPFLAEGRHRSKLLRLIAERSDHDPEAILENMLENRGVLRGLIRDHCDAIGLETFDYTRPLEHRFKRGDLEFLPFDTHLAPTGHAALAKGLYVRLLELGWLEGVLGPEAHKPPRPKRLPD